MYVLRHHQCKMYHTYQILQIYQHNLSSINETSGLGVEWPAVTLRRPLSWSIPVARCQISARLRPGLDDRWETGSPLRFPENCKVSKVCYFLSQSNVSVLTELLTTADVPAGRERADGSIKALLSPRRALLSTFALSVVTCHGPSCYL